MKCFNHPNQDIVATCIDCGKGLCADCARLYSVPICNECNLARSKNEKSLLISKYIPSILGFIAGIVIGISSEGDFFATVLCALLLAGIPWGWKVISFITPRIFLFLPIVGWVIYFLLKLILSMLVGVIAMPIGIIQLIIKTSQVNKAKQNIIQNING